MLANGKVFDQQFSAYAFQAPEVSISGVKQEDDLLHQRRAVKDLNLTMLRDYLQN